MTSYARGYASPMPSPQRRHDLLDLSDDDPRTLPGLRRIFLRFCSFGRGHRVDVETLKMDGRTFVKFARDTGLLSRRSLPQTSVDLIFTKLRRKGERSIDFEQFLVGLRHMAAHRGVAHDRLVAFVLKQHGLSPVGSRPAMSTPTRASADVQSQVQRMTTPPPPQMAGDAMTPPAARNSGMGAATPRCALVVVDMQVDFFTKNSAVSAAFPDLPARMQSLIDLCRSHAPDVEVIHLREGSNSNESPWYEFWQRLNPGCDSAADPALPEPCARETGSERIFVKLGYDGVGVDSGLTGYLNARGVKTVFVCGLVTSCCVHMNAAGLFLRGYQTFCVEDACGDRTRAMHTETLRRESRRSYGVVGSEDVATYLRALQGEGAGSDPERLLVEACWPNVTQAEKQ